MQLLIKGEVLRFPQIHFKTAAPKSQSLRFYLPWWSSQRGEKKKKKGGTFGHLLLSSMIGNRGSLIVLKGNLLLYVQWDCLNHISTNSSPTDHIGITITKSWLIFNFGMVLFWIFFSAKNRSHMQKGKGYSWRIQLISISCHPLQRKLWHEVTNIVSTLIRKHTFHP